MPRLPIVPHGDSAAVILTAAVLESAGLHVGDVLDVTLGNGQLILRPAEDALSAICWRRLRRRCSSGEETLISDWRRKEPSCSFRASPKSWTSTASCWSNSAGRRGFGTRACSIRPCSPPKTGATTRGPTCAATYAFHLTRNHPFVDGNKRVGAAVAEIFVRLNGAQLSASNDEIVAWFMGIAAGTVSREETEQAFARWATVPPAAAEPCAAADAPRE